MIETCKLNRVEPPTGIADVIHRIADDWPVSRWDGFMPWNWRPLNVGPVEALAA